MQIHQLRYFVAVADNGSFSKGALRLGVAQSADSLQVRRLEESLGTELFERSVRGAVLTASGHRLLGYATTILDQVALAETMVPGHAGARKIAIRLGLPSGIAQLLSVPLLKDVGDALPGIDLKIVEALSGDLQHQLSEGFLDIALLFKPREEGAASTGGSESVYLVEAIRNNTRVEPPIRLADLAGIALTMPTTRHQIRAFLSEQAARCGIKLSFRGELDGQARILQLVASGRASTVMLASSFLKEWHADKLTVRLIEDFGVEAVVVTGSSKKIAGSRAVEAVRRRVEILAHSVSLASSRLSPTYLKDS